MTDVVQTTEFEVAGIELSEIAEIAKIERFVNAVFSFVVAIVSATYLIDFRFDVIASIVVSIVEIANASIAVKRFLVFDVVKMNLMMIKNWFVDRFFDQMFSLSYNAFHFFLALSRIFVTDLM